MVFQYINIPQVPREVLKTKAFGLGFQHLPRDLANVNKWKTMFDPYIINELSYKEVAVYSAYFLWKTLTLKVISALRNWYNQKGKTDKYN